MVARLLHACGVFLGPEEELTTPDPDNTEGNYENRHFVRLNEEILARFGGSWDALPDLPAGWEFAPEADQFLERAESLIARSRRQFWGWKDPRNSLTLSLWQRLIPDLKVVVCLRNPLEVARSLFVRGDVEDPSDCRLWLTYYRQILSTTRPESRLVTHHRSYFTDARAELARLLDWLGVGVSDEIAERACANARAGLRHHSVRESELIEANVPEEVLGLYFSLCAEAGPVYRRAREGEAASPRDHAPADAEEMLLGELRQLRAFCNAREAAHEAALNDLTNELRQARALYHARDATLNEVLNSKSYKLVSWHWHLRRRRRRRV